MQGKSKKLGKKPKNGAIVENEESKSADVSLLVGDASFDDRMNKSILSYQVGEVDESGFVCIGIGERQLQTSADTPQKEKGYSGPGYYFSGNASDYSSSGEYSSDADGTKS